MLAPGATEGTRRMAFCGNAAALVWDCVAVCMDMGLAAVGQQAWFAWLLEDGKAEEKVDGPVARTASLMRDANVRISSSSSSCLHALIAVLLEGKKVVEDAVSGIVEDTAELLCSVAWTNCCLLAIRSTSDTPQITASPSDERCKLSSSSWSDTRSIVAESLLHSR